MNFKSNAKIDFNSTGKFRITVHNKQTGITKEGVVKGNLINLQDVLGRHGFDIVNAQDADCVEPDDCMEIGLWAEG